MTWDAEVAAEWERREQKIRKDIEQLRDELHRRYGETIRTQWRIISKIRNIPFIGKKLIEWAER